ncbi:MAG: hypothetical protein V5A61_02160 [Haloarculaceae archaeon]|jgi:hypothetical protein
MSAEVALALIGVTIVAMALLTYAAFRYVPMALGEEETEEQTGAEPPERREPPGENLAD